MTDNAQDTLPPVTLVTEPDERGWVNGRVGGLVFNAKVFDVGSRYGIDGGRVSKLTIPGLFSYERALEYGDPEDPHVRAVLALFPEPEGTEDPGPRWPEHEKLYAVKDRSQAVGEFLDYSGFVLAEYRPRWRELDSGSAAYLGRTDARVRDGHVRWATTSMFGFGRSVIAKILGEIATGEATRDGDNGSGPQIRWKVPVRDEEEARVRLRETAEAGGYADPSVRDLVPVQRPLQRILADYYGIDLDALDREKRDMLDLQRAANAAKEG